MLDHASVSDSVRRNLRTTSHPAALIRPDLMIVDANDIYSHRFSEPGGEVVGRRCFRISHGYSRPCDEMGERCPIHLAMAEGHAVDVVHEHFTKMGKVAEKVTMEPVRDADGAIAMFLEIIHTIETRHIDSRLIGHAPPFLRMMRLVERAAPSEVPVLLLGESGTGKELVAREIHRLSHRRDHAFVPVDCSGLAETLFESELFGHERGAFTGAIHAKKGLVEAARGGTLFLDEIGDVPLSQQVKLLRLLETGMYRRVGSVEQKSADFRLVCATHRDLRHMVDEGGFRRDLYYRINAFPVETPPLRARIDDLALLAEELLQRIGGKRAPDWAVAPEALRVLEGHLFPGNVRELANILQRASLLAEGASIGIEHLPDEITHAGARPIPDDDLHFSGPVIPLRDLEDRYLHWAVATFAGDRRTLARRLGLSERTLYRKLSALTGDGHRGV